MLRGSGALARACLLVALVCGWSGAAQAQYSLLSGSGVQYQIGGELPLPPQLVTTGGAMMSPIGTRTMFPPLLIPPADGATVMQAPGLTTLAPANLTLPPGVFKRVPSGPAVFGLRQAHARLWQVRTRLQFTAPGNFPATMTVMFGAGNRTGAKTAVFTAPGFKGFARYSKSAKQFGGPAQARLVGLTPGRFWLNGLGAKAPCKHPAFGGAQPDCVAALADGFLVSRAAAGGPLGFTTSSAPAPVMSPGVVALSVPNAKGTVAKSSSVAQTAPLTNMASSTGFPWTTGMLTLSRTTNFGTPEKFAITGMDNRTKMGAGTLSLVSGALSIREFSGPDVNRGWMRFSLPEPGAALGAGAALAALAVCHALARRRTR